MSFRWGIDTIPEYYRKIYYYEALFAKILNAIQYLDTKTKIKVWCLEDTNSIITSNCDY